MKHSENLNELAIALAKAQGKMEAASKQKENPHFRSKYADLASVWDAIRGPLAENNLSVVQLPYSDEQGRVCLSTMLLHSSGQWIEASYFLDPSKKDPQGYGSAITYMKRYALTGMGVAPEDDDGNAASQRANGNGSGHAPNYGKITADQAQTIRDMLASSKGDVEKFCKYYRIGAIPDLSATDYESAIRNLNGKLHPKGEARPSIHEH